jgi:hypothetical protein
MQRMWVCVRCFSICARLRQIKGIGPVTAWTLRAVIGRFDRLRNGKQISRYCGLTPKNASSGERVADAGLVRAGDPTLKTVLIQVAQRIVRRDGEWNSLYLGLLERGKPARVANRRRGGFGTVCRVAADIRDDGAVGVSVRSWIPPPLPGRLAFRHFFHGFHSAREARAALHPWLQAVAPLGRSASPLPKLHHHRPTCPRPAPAPAPSPRTAAV